MLALCDEVLAADPASGAAWIVKAETHYEARQFAEAVDAARRPATPATAPIPSVACSAISAAWDASTKPSDVCIRGLELFPRELSFQELLDGIVLEFRLLDRYLEACRRLFPLIEDKASFLGNEATVFLRMGDLAQARALYEQALAYGDYNWLHAQLGVVLRSQGDFPGAEPALQTAIRQEPHYTYAAERLAGLYVDWFFSYDRLAARFASDPGYPTQAALLARIHQFYERTAETLPNHHAIFRDYCQFCVRCGDLAPIKRLAPRYAERSSVYATVCCHLAEACEDLHDAQAQGEWLATSRVRDEPEPYKAEAYRLMGRYVHRCGAQVCLTGITG